MNPASVSVGLIFVPSGNARAGAKIPHLSPPTGLGRASAFRQPET
jgi:hypothetical protein